MAGTLDKVCRRDSRGRHGQSDMWRQYLLILEAAGAAAREAREHRVISVQFGAELCPTFGGKEEGGTAFL
jgi:hypothetical protein